MRITVDSI